MATQNSRQICMICTKMITRTTSSSIARVAQPWRTKQWQNRLFSSSRLCLAYFPPAFEPTQSSELDAILHTTRERVLLPRHLKGSTKRLVSNPKSSKQLEFDDIRIQIGDQEERLFPHDYSKDGVSWKDTFQKVLDLTTESKDFSIWPQLLKGADSAGLKLKSRQQEMLARKMCQTGNLSTLLNLLDSGSRWQCPSPPLIITLVPHAIRNAALTTDYLANARRVVPEDDEASWKDFKLRVESGNPIEYTYKTPELAQALAKTLQRGLARSLRLNLALARPEAHHKLLDEFYALNYDQPEAGTEKLDKNALAQRRSLVLNDPILAAVPLEMQSRLEALEANSPEVLQTAEETKSIDGSPVVGAAQRTTAAQYAQRLLHALDQSAKSNSTAPDLQTITKNEISLHHKAVTWILRELAVGAALRAAKDATTVKQDEDLLQTVSKRLDELIEGLDYYMLMIQDGIIAEKMPYLYHEYLHFKEEEEFGFFGGHTYPYPE